MQCEEVQKLLFEYLEGDLPDEARRQVEAHLAGCDSCAQLAEEYRRALAALGTLEKDVPDFVTPAMKKIKNKRRFAFKRAWGLGAAAVIVLALGVAYLWPILAGSSQGSEAASAESGWQDLEGETETMVPSSEVAPAEPAQSEEAVSEDETTGAEPPEATAIPGEQDTSSSAAGAVLDVVLTDEELEQLLYQISEYQVQQGVSGGVENDENGYHFSVALYADVLAEFVSSAADLSSYAQVRVIPLDS